MTLEKVVKSYYDDLALPPAEVDRILAAACPPSQRRSPLLWAAAAALLLAGAGLVFVLRAPDGGDEPMVAQTPLLLADPVEPSAPSAELLPTVAVPWREPLHAKGTVRLEIGSDPPGATVSIAGVRLGVTPLTLEQPVSERPLEIIIKQDGYEAGRVVLEAGAGETRHVLVNLRPEPAAVPAPVSKRAEHLRSDARTRQHYQAGVRLLQANELQDALRRFHRCLAEDDTYALCARALGITYAKLGNGPRAYRWYKRYFELSPKAKDAPQVREFLRQYEREGQPRPE